MRTVACLPHTPAMRRQPRPPYFPWDLAVAASLCTLGCGTEATSGDGSSTMDETSDAAAETATGGVDATDGGAEEETSAGDDASGGDGDGDGDGDEAPILDPVLPGPWPTAVLDDVFTVPTTGTSVNIQATYPTDAADAPYPVVLLAHGFQLAPSQYAQYGTHLATHGFIAVNVDFNADPFSTNHVENMREVLGGLEWISGHPMLGPLADLQRVGATGHSLGGKLATHAAAVDPRVGAAFTLDPVDSAMGCNETDCPDVTNLLPVNKPIGVIGETHDATGSLQACAPAADNFQTFYAAADPPALQVEVLGANHMSFIEDPASCGLPCSFCNAATLSNDVVTEMSRAYMVAFFARYLRDQPGYDTYLDGAMATARYVDTGLALVDRK